MSDNDSDRDDISIQEDDIVIEEDLLEDDPEEYDDYGDGNTDAPPEQLEEAVKEEEDEKKVATIDLDNLAQIPSIFNMTTDMNIDRIVEMIAYAKYALGLDSLYKDRTDIEILTFMPDLYRKKLIEEFKEETKIREIVPKKPQVDDSIKVAYVVSEEAENEEEEVDETKKKLRKKQKPKESVNEDDKLLVDIMHSFVDKANQIYGMGLVLERPFEELRDEVIYDCSITAKTFEDLFFVITVLFGKRKIGRKVLSDVKKVAKPKTFKFTLQMQRDAREKEFEAWRNSDRIKARKERRPKDWEEDYSAPKRKFVKWIKFRTKEDVPVSKYDMFLEKFEVSHRDVMAHRITMSFYDKYQEFLKDKMLMHVLIKNMKQEDVESFEDYQKFLKDNNITHGNVVAFGDGHAINKKFLEFEQGSDYYEFVYEFVPKNSFKYNLGKMFQLRNAENPPQKMRYMSFVKSDEEESEPFDPDEYNDLTKEQKEELAPLYKALQEEIEKVSNIQDPLIRDMMEVEVELAQRAISRKHAEFFAKRMISVVDANRKYYKQLAPVSKDRIFIRVPQEEKIESTIVSSVVSDITQRVSKCFIFTKRAKLLASDLTNGKSREEAETIIAEFVADNSYIPVVEETDMNSGITTMDYKILLGNYASIRDKLGNVDKSLLFTRGSRLLAKIKNLSGEELVAEYKRFFEEEMENIRKEDVARVEQIISQYKKEMDSTNSEEKTEEVFSKFILKLTDKDKILLRRNLTISSNLQLYYNDLLYLLNKEVITSNIPLIPQYEMTKLRRNETPSPELEERILKYLKYGKIQDLGDDGKVWILTHAPVRSELYHDISSKSSFDLKNIAKFKKNVMMVRRVIEDENKEKFLRFHEILQYNASHFQLPRNYVLTAQETAISNTVKELMNKYIEIFVKADTSTPFAISYLQYVISDPIEQLQWKPEQLERVSLKLKTLIVADNQPKDTESFAKSVVTEKYREKILNFLKVFFNSYYIEKNEERISWKLVNRLVLYDTNLQSILRKRLETKLSVILTQNVALIDDEIRLLAKEDYNEKYKDFEYRAVMMIFKAFPQLSECNNMIDLLQVMQNSQMCQKAENQYLEACKYFTYYVGQNDISADPKKVIMAILNLTYDYLVKSKSYPQDKRDLAILLAYCMSEAIISLKLKERFDESYIRNYTYNKRRSEYDSLEKIVAFLASEENIPGEQYLDIVQKEIASIVQLKATLLNEICSKAGLDYEPFHKIMDDNTALIDLFSKSDTSDNKRDSAVIEKQLSELETIMYRRYGNVEEYTHALLDRIIFLDNNMLGKYCTTYNARAKSSPINIIDMYFCDEFNMAKEIWMTIYLKNSGDYLDIFNKVVRDLKHTLSYNMIHTFALQNLGKEVPDIPNLTMTIPFAVAPLNTVCDYDGKKIPLRDLIVYYDSNIDGFNCISRKSRPAIVEKEAESVPEKKVHFEDEAKGNMQRRNMAEDLLLQSLEENETVRHLEEPEMVLEKAKRFRVHDSPTKIREKVISDSNLDENGSIKRSEEEKMVQVLMEKEMDQCPDCIKQICEEKDCPVANPQDLEQFFAEVEKIPEKKLDEIIHEVEITEVPEEQKPAREYVPSPKRSSVLGGVKIVDRDFIQNPGSPLKLGVEPKHINIKIHRDVYIPAPIKYVEVPLFKYSSVEPIPHIPEETEDFKSLEVSDEGQEIPLIPNSEIRTIELPQEIKIEMPEVQAPRPNPAPQVIKVDKEMRMASLLYDIQCGYNKEKVSEDEAKHISLLAQILEQKNMSTLLKKCQDFQEFYKLYINFAKNILKEANIEAFYSYVKGRVDIYPDTDKVDSLMLIYNDKNANLAEKLIAMHQMTHYVPDHIKKEQKFLMVDGESTRNKIRKQYAKTDIKNFLYSYPQYSMIGRNKLGNIVLRDLLTAPNLSESDVESRIKINLEPKLKSSLVKDIFTYLTHRRKGEWTYQNGILYFVPKDKNLINPIDSYEILDIIESNNKILYIDFEHTYMDSQNIKIFVDIYNLFDATDRALIGIRMSNQHLSFQDLRTLSELECFIDIRKSDCNIVHIIQNYSKKMIIFSPFNSKLKELFDVKVKIDSPKVSGKELIVDQMNLYNYFILRMISSHNITLQSLRFVMRGWSLRFITGLKQEELESGYNRWVNNVLEMFMNLDASYPGNILGKNAITYRDVFRNHKDLAMERSRLSALGFDRLSSIDDPDYMSLNMNNVNDCFRAFNFEARYMGFEPWAI